MTAFNEFGPLQELALRHPREAFVSQDKIDREWQAHGYHSKPDFDAALAEFDDLCQALEAAGARPTFLPSDAALTIDSIYVRDALLRAPGGLIACAMGKPERENEPGLNGQALTKDALTKEAQTKEVQTKEAQTKEPLPLLGTISGDGRLEGGDLVWLDEKTCAVGLTYRSNQAGVDQLQSLLGPEVIIQTADLPHYKGPGDVFHLMSILSPLDQDLALVYSPLMPIGFRRWLQDRGLSFVEVSDEEFEAMACNVLALAPRRCLMLEGCPETRRRLEAAGCAVMTYKGEEISRKGEGGPTCLTRPLTRG